jgi:hypothetical protein
MRISRRCVCLALALGGVPSCTHVTARRAAPSPILHQIKDDEGPPQEDNGVFFAMPSLLESINAARQSRGAPQLRVDRGLALVAQEAGAEYQKLGRGFEQRIAARANADLRSFSLTFARVAAVVVFVERLEQAESVLEPAMDPEMRFVGMSVAKSPPPTSAAGGYAVVVTLGR